MGPEKIRNDKVDRKWQNNAYQKGLCGRQVLIETYWNVNLIATELSIKVLPVLIETYWNVNLAVPYPVNENGGSINRNILECK